MECARRARAASVRSCEKCEGCCPQQSRSLNRESVGGQQPPPPLRTSAYVPDILIGAPRACHRTYVCGVPRVAAERRTARRKSGLCFCDAWIAGDALRDKPTRYSATRIEKKKRFRQRQNVPLSQTSGRSCGKTLLVVHECAVQI